MFYIDKMTEPHCLAFDMCHRLAIIDHHTEAILSTFELPLEYHWIPQSRLFIQNLVESIAGYHPKRLHRKLERKIRQLEEKTQNDQSWNTFYFTLLEIQRFIQDNEDSMIVLF